MDQKKQADLIVLGLTGSIGMGKSETAKIFRNHAIPVFDADQTVHDLMTEDRTAIDAIDAAFPGSCGPDGVDRLRLGAQVFGDKAALAKLEAIIHPLIGQKRQAFLTKVAAQGHDLAVLDVPLLFETGGAQNCDYTLVVSAPLSVQRARVLSRPGMTDDKLDHILAHQMPDQEKRQRADFIVQTDQGIAYADQQIQDIIANIRAKTKNGS